MRDLDAELVAAALAEGLITPEEQARVERLVAASKGKLYRAQVLVRERLIGTGELLTLQDKVRARIYECPHCKRRHPRAKLPKEAGAAFRCQGCDRSLRLDETRAGLSRIEVLASRDPRDLAVRLSEASTSETASDVSVMDLDRYEVEEELGRGGYGVVFKAFQRDLQRPVALKVLQTGVKLPEVALERFIREGRAASRLNHPNLVSVYDIGRYKDLFVLAMELVPGRPLKDVLKQRGRFPWPEAVALMAEILDGVGHAHAQGVVHRDLKTSNVIIEDGSGRPRIIDFGLAKDLHSDAHLTQAGAIVGTPFYLSPEQIEGRSAEVDARADVFALGVILYELLSGRRPFLSRLKTEIYAQILKDDPPPLEEQVDDLPPGLVEVVQRALAKRAADRYADAAAMRAALAPFLAGGEGGEPSEEPRPTRRARGTGRATRPRPRPGPRAAPAGATGGGLKAALVVGGALAIALVGFVVGRGGAPTPEVASAPLPEATARAGDPRPSPAAAAALAPEPPQDERENAQPERPAPPRPEPEAATAPEPVAPQPPPEPEPEPVEPEPAEPEPAEPAVAEVEAPEPEPALEAEAALAPEPAAPEPPPLDLGANDASEFPDLAARDAKAWLERAFSLNALAEAAPPTPRQIRALRLGLLDRFPLNRAFALRGLLRRSDAWLRAFGSQALFDNLLEVLGDDEPYLADGAQALLLRLAGGGEPRRKAAWRRWWSEEGEACFREAAATPPDLQLDLPSEAAQREQLASQSREVNQYFSELRDRGLDIVILMDVTTSMSEELARVRAQVNEITSFMDLLLEGKVRMGFVTYDLEVVQRLALTSRLGKFARAVEQIGIFNNPANTTVPEGVHSALADALAADNRLGWRPKAVRTLLLLGDAPPDHPDEARVLAQQAGENGFVLNALIAPPPAKYATRYPPKPAFEELARLAGGVTAEIAHPEELITQILVFAFGSRRRSDLERFVRAYREVTGSAAAAPQGGQ